VIAVAKKVTSI